MSKRCLFITVALVFLCSSAWAQLSTTSPWPKKHQNIKNTGETSANAGTITGKLKWAFITQGEIKSSPVLDAPLPGKSPKIYFGSVDGNFYAVNRSTGTLEWNYKLQGAVEFCSPAIDVNGIVYIGDFSGTVYAFDTKTIDPGNASTWVPVWTYTTSPGGAIQSSINIDVDGTIIVASTNGYVYALNPNGSLKWRTPHNYGSIYSSTPAIDNSLIVFGTQGPQNRISFTLAPESVLCSFIDIYSAPVFFSIDSTNAGSEVSNFPQFCPPGGMFASPVVFNNGNYLVPLLKKNYGSFCADNDLELQQAEVWDIGLGTVPLQITDNYPFDNDCSIKSLPVSGGSGTGFPGDVWSTPAVLGDSSYIVADGTRIARYLPGGNPYNDVIIDVGARIESSPAVDKKQDYYLGTDGGVFYSICSKCTEPDTLINWKYPSDGTTLKSQDGSRTVEIKSSPAIDNDEKHSVYVGANNGIMYGFFDGPSIKGTVKLRNNNPLNGVKISIKNVATGVIVTLYTDTNGAFKSSGLDNGQYTVTAQLNNYVFDPSSFPVTVTNTDATADFVASLSYSLNGKVTNASDGTGLPGVSIALVTKNPFGDIVYTDNSTQTDSNGDFIFTNIGYGTTTLTPSRPGWGFDPPLLDQVITSADAEGTTFTGLDFQGTLGYQISGKVIDPTILDNTTENGIENVKLTITGSAPFTTESKFTNPQGNFSFTGLPNGTYKITPSLGLYKFSPKTVDLQINDASILNQNFYGATGITISGNIKLPATETSFEGFTVNLYRDDETLWSKIFNRNKPRTLVATATVSSPSGFFIFMGVDAGKYIVEPTAPGYGFSPASTKVSALTDVANLTFTASAGFTISGRVTNLLGFAESGISLILTNNSNGSTVTAQSGLDGTYTFNGLQAGSYTVAPEPSIIYYALPSSTNVTVTLENLRKINFRLINFCSKTYITLPFWGADGDTVNVIGTNFGPPPTDTANVAVTLSDGTEASVPAGVYFGTNDPDTWISATVTSWTPFYIAVKVPILDGRVLRVWVVKPGLTACIAILPTNFFLNTRM